MNRNYRLLLAFIPALLTFLVYIPSLGNGFVNWDDPTYVLENARIRSLDAGFLKFAFTSFYFSNWHPLTLVSYALDYALWKDAPFGYHLANNILHAINTALVFVAVLVIAGKKRASAFVSVVSALIGAALFGLHPLHVESVSWVSERKDLLCAFFYLLSALAYMRYITSGVKALWYLLSLASFALALMSKPMAVSLPFALILLDIFPFARLRDDVRRVFLEKVPFLALAAASSVLTILAQRTESAIMPTDKYPVWMRAFSALKALGLYVYNTVFPAHLAPYYPLSGRAELMDFSMYASAALVTAITIASLIAVKKTRAPIVAWLFFVVTLVPVIGLVQVGSQAAADRYTYIPLIGPFMLAGAVAATALERSRRQRRALFIAASVAVVSAFIALGALTIRQESYWKDSISLWDRQIQVYPGKAPHVYNMRGLAHDERGRYLEAIADFDAAIALDPKNAFAYNNRGNAHKAVGDFREAVDDFLMAASIAPRRPEPYVNLSVLYDELGEVELALAAKDKARSLGWR